jgi:hypothetical protein
LNAVYNLNQNYGEEDSCKKRHNTVLDIGRVKKATSKTASIDFHFLTAIR